MRKKKGIFYKKGRKVASFLRTVVRAAALEEHKAADWLQVRFISCAHNAWKRACNYVVLFKVTLAPFESKSSRRTAAGSKSVRETESRTRKEPTKNKTTSITDVLRVFVIISACLTPRGSTLRLA